MIGDRIRLLRENLNMSRAEFGGKLNVSADVINNWERNRVVCPGNNIRLISLVFNVREGWLETGEGEMFQETAQSYVEKLIAEHDMGPGGRALMRSLLRFYEELGEEATLKVIEEIVAIGQDALAEKEAADFTARWLGDGEESSQGSAGSA